MNRNTHKIIVLICSIFVFAACSSKFTKLQKSGTVQDKYKAALGYYEGKDYYRAGILFEEIAPLLRGDSTAEKAQFLNAYCNYNQGLYQMSSYMFKNFYATYANSPMAEEAFYMSAYSMFRDSPKYDLDQASSKLAIDALQNFINTYPQSEYAGKCSQNLIDLRAKLEKKDYERAKQYYTTSGVTIANFKSATIAINNFMKDFPDSPYREELAFIQLDSQTQLAESSFFKFQHDRFSKAIGFYHDFVDKYPNSKFMKQALKSYSTAQKGLEEVNKIQKEVDEIKAKAEEKKAKASSK